jgi:hypothetical protein
MDTGNQEALNSALSSAVSKRDVVRARELLEQGAKANLVTPLRNKDVAMMTLLLDYGADPMPHYWNTMDERPAYFECFTDNIPDSDTFAAYIQAVQDSTRVTLADIRRLDGRSLLHLAVLKGYPREVETLLSAGMDPNLRCECSNGYLRSEYDTPIDINAKSHCEIVDVLRIRKMLLDAGAMPTGQTLYNAMSSAKYAYVDTLLSMNVEPTKETMKLAIRCGYLNVIPCLSG